MKKNFCIIFLVLLFCFIGYKFIFLLRYKTEKVFFQSDKIFNETINVNYKNRTDNVFFDRMFYYDYFSDYVDKDDSNFKVKYDEFGEVVSFYNISREKQYINLLNINSFLYSDQDVDYSTSKDMRFFLIKKHINNDIDLMKYIKDNYYLKNNLFTSIKMMKINYIFNSYVSTTLPNFNSISLIQGDKINGYIMNINSDFNIRVIHLLYNDEQYIITLAGQNITSDEFINDFLESIYFE